MRVLLDTNIVIHRENNITSNYSIGHLFKWLDKLKHTKIIHPFTIEEIRKFNQDEKRLEAILVKLQSYEQLKTIIEPTQDYLNMLSGFSVKPNDKVDNVLLFEVQQGRVDLLITEDKGIHKKADVLGLSNKVFTINRFITLSTEQNPELVEYSILSVRKRLFGQINLQSEFFDTFRRDYTGFDLWFNRKCDETAYICGNDKGEILGFLYIKVEDKDENYSDIQPTFTKKKRLKIGTFKVESTGFRLGERFLKIIFDNAIQYNVDEIYVTMFSDRQELIALSSLLQRWGFRVRGIKESGAGVEQVLVKRLKLYNDQFSPKMNFPNLKYNKQKFILPIYARYHTSLLPDSILRTENEVDFMQNEPHKYALQKVYISFGFERNINPGDFIMFYRTGTGNKKYTSVLTTLCVMDEVQYDFTSKDRFFEECQNRTVFPDYELEGFWKKTNGRLIVVKFIQVKSFNKKITLGELWNSGIVQAPKGPRPFTRLTDDQFNYLLQKAQTDVSIYV